MKEGGTPEMPELHRQETGGLREIVRDAADLAAMALIGWMDLPEAADPSNWTSLDREEQLRITQFLTELEQGLPGALPDSQVPKYRRGFVKQTARTYEQHIIGQIHPDWIREFCRVSGTPCPPESNRDLTASLISNSGSRIQNEFRVHYGKNRYLPDANPGLCRRLVHYFQPMHACHRIEDPLQVHELERVRLSSLVWNLGILQCVKAMVRCGELFCEAARFTIPGFNLTDRMSYRKYASRLPEPEIHNARAALMDAMNSKPDPIQLGSLLGAKQLATIYSTAEELWKRELKVKLPAVLKPALELGGAGRDASEITAAQNDINCVLKELGFLSTSQGDRYDSRTTP